MAPGKSLSACGCLWIAAHTAPSRCAPPITAEGMTHPIEHDNGCGQLAIQAGSPERQTHLTRRPQLIVGSANQEDGHLRF